MPSNWTSPLQLQKIATGEQVNVWGDSWNVNLDNIADGIRGFETIALTGNYTLLSGNLTTNEARHAIIKFTGGVGPFTVTIPTAETKFTVWNATTGTITVTTGAGTTVQVSTTDIVEVFCDATNVKTLGYGGNSLKDYIASVVVGGGASLPSLSGNSGKWLTNNGTIASWALPSTTDLQDLTTYTAARTAFAVAMAVAFSR